MLTSKALGRKNHQRIGKALKLTLLTTTTTLEGPTFALWMNSLLLAQAGSNLEGCAPNTNQGSGPRYILSQEQIDNKINARLHAI